MSGLQENKYGLGRYIPSDVRRKVRQECGFGCVLCGCAIYEYEHVDPPFNEAREHEPDKIALLCGTHHSAVTRGILSKDTVKQARKNPRCFQNGFSFGAFDVSNQTPIIVLGTITFEETPILVEAFGDPLLKIDTPEEDGGPFRLSGIFYNNVGEEIFKIVENEWQGSTENWDIEIVGPQITIRRATREIALQIRTDPPSKLTIERLDMYYKGFRIMGEEGKHIEVESPQGRKIYTFGPMGTKSIIQSLGSMSEEAKEQILAKYDAGVPLPGVTFRGCKAGIVLYANGDLSIGEIDKMLPKGGSMLMTF